MYVTLEPCCHLGKTPPCTNAIIKSGIKKVIAATKDPTKKVNGKGLKILKKTGIKIVTGICKNEAQNLNAPFFKFTRTKKPWVIIKWAQSADGFLARTDKKRWITNSASRKDAHKLRRKVQAILVGINTVLVDDPMLTARRGVTASQRARPHKDKRPLRVVLDSLLKIPIDCKIIRTAKKAPVLVFTTNKNNKKTSLLKKKGAEIIAIPSAKGKCNLKTVLAKLAQRDIQQVLIEGGPTIITSFLKQGLADEICVYIAPKILGSRGTANITKPMAELSGAVGLYYVDTKRFGDDIRITGLPEKTVDELLTVGDKQ